MSLDHHYFLKTLQVQFRKHKGHRFDPWVGKIPWRREQQPTPEFLPGESHGQMEPGGLQPTEFQRARHGTPSGTQHQFQWAAWAENQGSGSVVKNAPANEGDRQPTPGLLPGKSLGQRDWWATVHGVTRVKHNLATEQQQAAPNIFFGYHCTFLQSSDVHGNFLRMMFSNIQNKLCRIQLYWSAII